jgi:AcrR family transcriptional regulator
MPAEGGRYHHGDLRPALVDAAIDVISERGVRGFSLAEASRRLSVTTAAPYRHFADRDELLATVAVRALCPRPATWIFRTALPRSKRRKQQNIRYTAFNGRNGNAAQQYRSGE